MRKLLVPYFIGNVEPNLDKGIFPFDTLLSEAMPRSTNPLININCEIRDFVSETIQNRDKPFVLSGDCITSIGCLAGLQRHGLITRLIWIDAHGDFHTNETTLSGHLGGMPLAMIVGRGDLRLLEKVGLTPIRENQVIHIGARDLEDGERETLFASNIQCYSHIADIIDLLPFTSSYWLHFDTDYLDPLEAPAMRYPVVGGPSIAAVKSEIENLVAQRRNILGMSVSAWAPHLDTEGKTAKACRGILSTVVDM